MSILSIITRNKEKVYMNENEIQFTELLEKAKEASKTSYSPYSKFAVGAACLFESGKFI